MDANIKTLHLCLCPLKNDTENWILHCLELDLIGLGRSEEEAFIQLLRAIKVQWTLKDRLKPSHTEIPSLWYESGEAWQDYHLEASHMASSPLHQILTQWQASDGSVDTELQLLHNPHPFTKNEQYRLVYDLIEVLYGINHRLLPEQKLKLDNGLAEEHKVILGKGLTGHLQSYPIPYGKSRRLSGHYVEQLFNRFALDLATVPELIAPRVVHHPSP